METRPIALLWHPRQDHGMPFPSDTVWACVSGPGIKEASQPAQSVGPVIGAAQQRNRASIKDNAHSLLVSASSQLGRLCTAPRIFPGVGCIPTTSSVRQRTPQRIDSSQTKQVFLSGDQTQVWQIRSSLPRQTGSSSLWKRLTSTCSEVKYGFAEFLINERAFG